MGTIRSDWAEFWRTPLLMRLYLATVAVAALVLPIAMSTPVRTPHTSAVLTAGAILAVSALNVEVSRWLSGGLATTHQPHKALSARAITAALLLPTWWLLVIVPITYVHARWRGLRIELWKWVGSGLYLVLCGFAAARIRFHVFGEEAAWADGDGLRGFLTMVLAISVFLALEAALFAGSAFLNRAEDEQWLRATLSSPGFYLTEAGVLFLGGLFAMVWTAGFWFALFFVPLYVMVQHAVLLAPLRERAAVAAELAENNARLDRNNQFMNDLMGMLGHELRTPLTSLIGYAQVGADVMDDDPDQARRSLEAVERNALRLADVLTDIGHLVASDQGMLTADPRAIALGPELRAAAEDLPADSRPEVICDDGIEVLVQPGHLDQILTNLLSNATKYGGGAVLLTARAAHEHVEIAVIDRGDGVPEPFVDKLFQRYRRDSTTSATVQGTGIGLFISRELARANGGDLTYRPAEPTGAHFVIRLPARVHAARD